MFKKERKFYENKHSYFVCLGKKKGESQMKIALIAHDKKKKEMIELAKDFEDKLSKHILVATGTTGLKVMQNTSLEVKRCKSGPLGEIKK